MARLMPIFLLFLLIGLPVLAYVFIRLSEGASRRLEQRRERKAERDNLIPKEDFENGTHGHPFRPVDELEAKLDTDKLKVPGWFFDIRVEHLDEPDLAPSGLTRNCAESTIMIVSLNETVRMNPTVDSITINLTHRNGLKVESYADWYGEQTPKIKRDLARQDLVDRPLQWAKDSLKLHATPKQDDDYRQVT